jgi:hypothetical protein
MFRAGDFEPRIVVETDRTIGGFMKNHHRFIHEFMVIGLDAGLCASYQRRPRAV